MMHESGILDCENIEQQLLVISKVMEHRNVQNIGNGMKKLGMFGRVVDSGVAELTGHEIRLFTEYNEFIGRASTFEEEWKAQNGFDDDDEF